MPHFIDKTGSRSVEYDSFSCRSSIFDAGTIDAEFSWFPKSDRLEFKNATLGFDTTQMGLRCDEFRRSLPDPTKFLVRPNLACLSACLPLSLPPSLPPSLSNSLSLSLSLSLCVCVCVCVCSLFPLAQVPAVGQELLRWCPECRRWQVSTPLNMAFLATSYSHHIYIDVFQSAPTDILQSLKQHTVLSEQVHAGRCVHSCQHGEWNSAGDPANDSVPTNPKDRLRGGVAGVGGVRS